MLLPQWEDEHNAFRKMLLILFTIAVSLKIITHCRFPIVLFVTALLLSVEEDSYSPSGFGSTNRWDGDNEDREKKTLTVLSRCINAQSTVHRTMASLQRAHRWEAVHSFYTLERSSLWSRWLPAVNILIWFVPIRGAAAVCSTYIPTALAFSTVNN